MVAAAFSALVVVSAPAAEVTVPTQPELDLTLRAWCSQAGAWRGRIEITDAQGRSSFVALVSKHSCTPDARYHVVLEEFIPDGRAGRTAESLHTVKVTFADPSLPGFRTRYFASGRSEEYRFTHRAVTVRDPQHWTQQIESPPPGEMFEGRLAVLRYTRERIGDRIVSRKEVRFAGEPSFTTRSVIEQQFESASK
jgi:hypothetical protein